MHDNDHIIHTPPAKRRRWAPAAAGLAAAGALLLGGATAAFVAAPGGAQQPGYGSAIKLVVTNPRPGDIAGTGGDFTVDLKATALNATGNQELSAANGYRPG